MLPEPAAAQPVRLTLKDGELVTEFSCRWRELMQKQPVDLTLRYSWATLKDLWDGVYDPDVSKQVRRLWQVYQHTVHS
jgi:hypothetical protein